MTLPKWVVATLGTFLGAAIMLAILNEGRISSMETSVADLKDGVTIKMAPETRERFNGVEFRLGEIERRLINIESAVLGKKADAMRSIGAIPVTTPVPAGG